MDQLIKIIDETLNRYKIIYKYSVGQKYGTPQSLFKGSKYEFHILHSNYNGLIKILYGKVEISGPALLRDPEAPGLLLSLSYKEGK